MQKFSACALGGCAGHASCAGFAGDTLLGEEEPQGPQGHGAAAVSPAEIFPTALRGYRKAEPLIRYARSRLAGLACPLVAGMKTNETDQKCTVKQGRSRRLLIIADIDKK